MTELKVVDEGAVLPAPRQVGETVRFAQAAELADGRVVPLSGGEDVA
jgi:hypothetical protein